MAVRTTDNGKPRIPSILDSTACTKHAPKGVPCFHIKPDRGNGYFPAICGDRAKKAGFVEPTQAQKDERRRLATRGR